MTDIESIPFPIHERYEYIKVLNVEFTYLENKSSISQKNNTIHVSC